ncbi:hypothetical protein AWV79_34105 [Cupriavidus sp. UYMMa02A]|nr:hypothetical protein AWV79_34105 [Cupriavidus sp. UYMMa02A]
MILGAARIDDLLLHLFKKHLLEPTTADDKAFKSQGPLATFSGRIEWHTGWDLFRGNFATLSMAFEVLETISLISSKSRSRKDQWQIEF